MKTASLALLVASMIVLAPAASAERPERMREGFYFRWGMGTTALRNIVSVAPDGQDDLILRGVDTGTGGAFNLEFGGLIEDGLAMSIFVLVDWISGEADDDPNTVLISTNSLTLTSLGLSLTYYPDPDGSFYTAAGFGFGTTTKSDPGIASTESTETSGVAGFLSGGWEFRISDGWALGAALRLHVNGGGNDLNNTQHRAVGAAAVLTTSYN